MAFIIIGIIVLLLLFTGILRGLLSWILNLLVGLSNFLGVILVLAIGIGLIILAFKWLNFWGVGLLILIFIGIGVAGSKK